MLLFQSRKDFDELSHLFRILLSDDSDRLKMLHHWYKLFNFVIFCFSVFMQSSSMELEADSSLEVRKRLSLLREHGIGELGCSFRRKLVLSITTHSDIL